MAASNLQEFVIAPDLLKAFRRWPHQHPFAFTMDRYKAPRFEFPKGMGKRS